MATNKEEDSTKLRLDRSRTARAFGEKESLWEAELFRMFDLVDTHIKALSSAGQDTALEDLPLLSIGLFGTYGSG